VSSFKEVFDVAQLEEHELGHLVYVLNSPSYIRVFEPYLVRARDSLNILLIDPSDERKKKYPCDYLRGGICAIDGLLALFAKLIDETDIERIGELVSQRTDEDRYTQLRMAGLAGPLAQSVKEQEYNPDEDY
jgi:hypothetical protein